MTDVNWVALIILVVLFTMVAVMGFWASRWRRPESMESLDEWGLGGRSFGTWVTWFLLGGDLYTAYTFVAVPAAMFGAGAVSGFFAVPYTIILYPIIFIFMSRLWSVSHRHGYVTPADFVSGRHGSRGLSLAVAITGFVATMPYIALQLVGIQAVLEVTGVGGSGNVLAADLPLFIAFVVLALYTYTSGLRAPALIAFVKDILIYLVIIVAIIYLPSRFGGWEAIFGAAEKKMATPNPTTGAPTGVFIPSSAQYWAYASLALGSAMALFMYPHSITGSLAVEEPQHDSPQRGDPAGLQPRARPLGPARLGRDRGRYQAGRPGRQAERAARHPAAVRGQLPGLVRRGRVRGHRDRRAGPGGDHVDRGSQHLHPEHLQGVDQEGRDRPAGGQGLQDRVPGGQGVRAGLRPRHGQAERDQPPAARRDLDPADASRPSCSASTRGGSTGGRCSRVGRSA